MSGFLAVLAVATLACGEENQQTRARQLLLRGKYAEAAEIFGRETTNHPEVAIGLARAHAARGRLDEADKTLDGAVETLKRSDKKSHATETLAAVLAEQARLAFAQGDHRTAKTRVEAALAECPQQVLARWIQAELARTSGRIDEADRAYRWLVEHYNDQDVRNPDSLHWIGLAAAQNARWNRLAEQFHFLVHELYPEAIQTEPDYWPAHYEMGRLYLEKFNQADAEREFKAALEINPNAAEVHAAMASLYLTRQDIVQAEASLQRALEINPRLLEARVLLADLAWINDEPEEAVRLLEKEVLPLCPVDEEVLGRLAAGYWILDGAPIKLASARLVRLTEEVNRRNKHAGEFYAAAAAWLVLRHQDVEARRYLHEVSKRLPQRIGSERQLGALAMQTGRETDARRLLEEALRIDPFNLRVNNTLQALDLLDGYRTTTSDHVVLKFDPAHDKLLARYALAYMDRVYPELCKQYGFVPSKPLVEIFSEGKGATGHQWFSVRMIELPMLGTIGASTGWIVAMVSTHDRQLARRFNWARVLKHELVHVITLQQTRFNIPHWFTEALAVKSEDHPRPQTWNQLLVQRLARKRLFNLQTINRGFTRPESSDDWTMAYCQAELYLDYLIERGGRDVAPRLLAAYREDRSTPTAIRRVLGVSLEEFERGYVDYLHKLGKGLQDLEPPSPEGSSFSELIEAHRASPNDPRLVAELGLAYLRRGAGQEARSLAETVLAREPRHPTANYLIARLEAKEGHTAESVARLEKALDRQKPDRRVLSLLAGLKFQAKQYAQATDLYALGEEHFPNDLQWTNQRARLSLLTKDDASLAKALARLAENDYDDVLARKKLAELALAQKDYPTAENWANRALEIDVADADTHQILAESLSNRGAFSRAIEEYEVVVELRPDDAPARFALASACGKAGQLERARRELEELLKRNPRYPGAEELLHDIKNRKRN